MSYRQRETATLSSLTLQGACLKYCSQSAAANSRGMWRHWVGSTEGLLTQHEPTGHDPQEEVRILEKCRFEETSSGRLIQTLRVRTTPVRMLRALDSRIFSISRDGNFTNLMDNELKNLNMFFVKNVFIIFNCNVFGNNLCLSSSHL